MKRAAFVALFGGMALACGGGGGGGGGGGTHFKDPSSVTFDFSGAAQTPSSTEQSASAEAKADLGDGMAVQGETDANLAAEESQSVANLPSSMSSVFAGSLPLPTSRALARAEASVVQRAAAYASGNLAAATDGWDNPNCWSVTGTATTGAVVFNNCTQTIPSDSSGASGSVSVNGSFNRDGGRIFWDATLSIHMSGPTDGGTMNVSATDRLAGDITFDTTAKTIAGSARSEIALSVSAPGESASGAVTYSVDLDLQYGTDSYSQFCITGGTLIAKRFWSVVPSGVQGDPGEFADAGVQFTWAPNGGACSNSVTVVWGK